MAISLVTELERVANALTEENAETTQISLTAIGDRIARHLGVQKDEVAILGLSQRWKHLHFLVPQALKHVGFIPLSSNSALAAYTAKESRPEINNNFPAARHASVFEGVRSATTSGEAIQKIISAPILCDGKVVGVMQVSRKGLTPQEAGADFTADDLGKVLALCRPLGKLLQHLGGNEEAVR
jgi:GAF domain-containing protein